MKLNIMLIDDCKIDLFINQKVIEKLVIDSNIRTFVSAKTAIEFLKMFDSKACDQIMFIPDLILLDINMPEMNGFEFLNAFKNLKNTEFENIKICMLSSSTNMNDVKKAKKESVGFSNKPLTTHSFEKIITEFKPYLKKFDSHGLNINLKEIKRAQ